MYYKCHNHLFIGPSREMYTYTRKCKNKNANPPLSLRRQDVNSKLMHGDIYFLHTLYSFILTLYRCYRYLCHRVAKISNGKHTSQLFQNRSVCNFYYTMCKRSLNFASLVLLFRYSIYNITVLSFQLCE